ncbi:MAG: hypothetical protein JXB49_12230 [Bacteroidales bacterium]|nr:hypothetical protein [Bacteroidales bacterium]
MRIAVIDLGTNTFNLIIAEYTSNGLIKTLHNSRIAVKLGQRGINNKILSQDAIERGIDAIDNHLKTISRYNVDQSLAFATSAIRNATNQHDFIKQVYENYGIKIQILTGDQEAELIYKGVKLTLNGIDKRFLILDIGGGSNEYIIADKDRIYWKRSFESGIARLIEKFNPSDPITNKEILELQQFLETGLQALQQASAQYKPEILIGASGSFDTFVRMIFKRDDLPCMNPIPIDDFNAIYKKLVESAKNQRITMQGIEKWQVEFIVPAIILVKTSLKITRINTIYQTAYSLKEGVMSQYLPK